MTAQHDLDRTLDAWFHGSATTAPPAEPLARVLESARQIRPRGAFVARVGSSWTDADRTGAGTSVRPALVLALVALLALALAGGALLVGSRLVPHLSKPAPFSEYRNGVIAVPMDGDIFVVDRPGGALRPLVTGPGDDSQPMFSPDGTKLAFVREMEQGRALMLADADGTNVVQLGSEPIDDEYLSFSPDGRFLVGAGQEAPLGDGDATYRIVIHPTDAAAAPIVPNIHLHDNSQMVFEWGGPKFRPTNSQEILVVGTLKADGPYGIYVYDLATGGIRTVAEPAGGVFDVKWSANGESVSYSLQAEGTLTIHVIGADGSGDRLLDEAAYTISPWSNDGTRIVVARPRGGAERELEVISTGGGGETVKLACGPSTDIPCPERVSWSPDDSTLVGMGFRVDETAEDGVREITLEADPVTGTVTEVDWGLAIGDAQQWQRVAP